MGAKQEMHPLLYWSMCTFIIINGHLYLFGYRWFSTHYMPTVKSEWEVNEAEKQEILSPLVSTLRANNRLARFEVSSWLQSKDETAATTESRDRAPCVSTLSTRELIARNTFPSTSNNIMLISVLVFFSRVSVSLHLRFRNVTECR